MGASHAWEPVHLHGALRRLYDSNKTAKGGPRHGCMPPHIFCSCFPTPEPTCAVVPQSILWRSCSALPCPRAVSLRRTRLSPRLVLICVAHQGSAGLCVILLLYLCSLCTASLPGGTLLLVRPQTQDSAFKTIAEWDVRDTIQHARVLALCRAGGHYAPRGYLFTFSHVQCFGPVNAAVRRSPQHVPPLWCCGHARFPSVPQPFDCSKQVLPLCAYSSSPESRSFLQSLTATRTCLHCMCSRAQIPAQLCLLQSCRCPPRPCPLHPFLLAWVCPAPLSCRPWAGQGTA